MDTTFITIHDLSPESRILYASDSVVDILGHTPDEVVGRSSWDFFHPDELLTAKEIHNKGVTLDKAAVLAYCQIRNRQGQWVCCESCFTVVYDVMVVCTSIYRRGLNSQKRAVEAPIVRRLFSASPKDPRYHMLTHLSSKFQLGPQDQSHEPRAALFLNRFTRTLTIMYATSGIEQIIGIPGEAMKGRSFYYCIQENCLEDAVRCLEGAKGNDSIAYLRFWYRDPRQDDQPDTDDEDTDEAMTDVTSDDNDEGDDESSTAQKQSTSASGSSHVPLSSEAESSRAGANRGQQEGGITSSSGSNPVSPASTGASADRGPIELEAVVSCTSDGLVVILRRARAVQPPTLQLPQGPAPAQQFGYPNGLFAAPWAPNPTYLPQQPQVGPAPVFQAGRRAPNWQLPVPPQLAAQPQPAYYAGGPANPGLIGYGGALQEAFLQSIRDVAVFAWALTGINGTLEAFSRGKASGDAQPQDGFPVWKPDGRDDSGNGSASSASSHNGHGPAVSNGSGSGSLGRKDPFGDPGLSGS